jgi:YD repeat-containing protein
MGMHVAGPPMLRPADIDAVVKAAARRRALVPASIPVQKSGNVRRPGVPGVVPAPSTRRAQSLPGNPSASGTGINPWWRYQEQGVPGGGHLMVNVGTGNLVLQDDDMAVPHKGIAMAFRRTYNSQSQHDVNGTDGGRPGLYGNGWTNSFDAHLSGSSTGTLSVWDVDGARYDYAWNGAGYDSVTPGQHATLVSDGGCGRLWTKKSGTMYYFYQPDWGTACGTWVAGYGGRLYQIIGRNRNTYLTFNYTWDNGDASITGKVNTISAQAESGMSATLTFANVGPSNYRLLQQITFPDGATTVQYGYDANGNLNSVSRPPNNAAGTRPLQTFASGQLGSGFVLAAIASPRWNASDNGAYVNLGYTGSDAPSSTLSGIAHVGVMNPAIFDGVSSGGLQSGYTTDPMMYLYEWYQTGIATPTYRDTDGHYTNWVVDGVGRPTQTQECTATTGIWTCSGTVLATNEIWDANNNLTAATDARGYETDSAYDANGNSIAVGAPQTATSQGTFRPTKLYDYDAFNNVTAYCDETETHAAGADWVSPPGPSDSLCSSHAVPHAQFSFAYPSYEPYGRLATMTTPLGYSRHYLYTASQQAGNDYGLPTSVTGDSFIQIDGSSIVPAQSFWYDGTGNLRCYSRGQGPFVFSYDALGRLTSSTDPDDMSANAGSVCGKTTGQPSWNTQATYTYFPDGAKQTAQTPPERAGGVSTGYTYNLDGNEITESHHFGCSPGNACVAGVTTKWYDGADRLIEIAQPQDRSDLYPYAWLTRYLYDLTQSGNISIASASYRAYGNLFKTQEWLTPPGATSPSWTDLRGNAFDALDRTIAKYTFSPSTNTTLRTATTQYDGSSATLGFLSSEVDPLSETTAFTYDELGRQNGVTFGGDGGVTPARTVIYDPNGRTAAASGAAYGSQTTRYDADGRVAEVDESTTGSVTSPARMTYDYYPNGDRKDLNVSSSALTATPLLTYVRRSDGELSKESLYYGGAGNTFTWSYTDGGRKLNQTDPYTGTIIPSPQAPVSPGTTYAPTTWSYDGTGQLTGTGLPETLNYSVTHDDEGHTISSAATITGSSSFVAGQSYWVTTRGENFQQSVNPTPTASTFTTRPANGALVPGVLQKPAPSEGSSPVFDPMNAAVLGNNLTGTAFSDGTTISCGTYPNVDSYDAASRLVSRPNYSLNPGSACNAEGPNQQTWAYDAEDHTISQAAGAAQWGPTGKPYRISGSGTLSDSLHYDGDSLLFVTNSQGALSDLKVGALADVLPGTQLTVWDRDSANMLATRHDNVSYYGMAFGGRKFGPFRGGEGPGSIQPQGVAPVFLKGSTTAPACPLLAGTTQCQNPAGPYSYSRLEGFDWGNQTIQGARTVDNTTGQWTTPDAYAGDVHDPMSQKPFMWDNNNPYEYSDPSGYYPGQVGDASGNPYFKEPANPLPRNLKYRDEIYAAAKKAGIDPFLMAALAAQESGHPDMNNGSATASSADGGRGLFQIQSTEPVHAAFFKKHDWKDPLENATYAAQLIKDALSQAKGDLAGALRYNNTGAVSGRKSSNTDWGDGATLDYPASVMRHYNMLIKMLKNQ